jgi:isopenicillin-N N-acyltransferase-like protein
VTSGMNAAGVAVVVHGGRAGRTLARGEPVLHALRRVLGTARTTEEAVAALGDRTPMVSHIVIVTDAAGTAVAVERVPGEAPFVRPLGERSAVTNHLEGPAAGDPKNQRVRRTTTTLARRARADELLAHLPANANVPDAVSLLRDRDGVGDTRLPLGDRRAIDALIATHGVVMNATRRVLWVSEGPHLIGRFIAFDLGRLLADGFDPADDRRPPPTLPPADLLTSGAYARWVAGPDGHP